MSAVEPESGATITAGLFLGYTRSDAARFSFLLSVPAIVGSGVWELRDIGEGNAPSFGITLLATVVAFVVGYASIAWLLRWLGSHSTMIFVVYRVALGILVLSLVGGGVIDARCRLRGQPPPAIEGGVFRADRAEPLPYDGHQSTPHGTTVADIILTLAPRVRLYSADVFGASGHARWRRSSTPCGTRSTCGG